MLAGRQLSDQRFQLDALDGLRGFAVLIVFLAHASNAGAFLVPGVNFAGNGRSGVYLFFVLSAFLLTVPFLTSGERAFTRPFLVTYALRRFLRIFPLYSLYLLAGYLSTLVLSRGIPFTLTWEQFVAHLLLQEGRGVTWSIVAEFRYYLLLPIVALVHARVLKNRLLPCALFTVALVLASRALWPPAEARPDDIRLGPYLPIFFAGSLLAVAHEAWRTSALRRSAAIGTALDVAAAAALLGWLALTPVVAQHWIDGPVTLDVFHNAYLRYALLWSVVLFASIHGRGLFRAVFEWMPLRYLGFISFSVYLLHIVVIRHLDPRLGLHPAADAWIMLAATVALSHATWMVIERPTSRLGASRARVPAGAVA